MQLELNYSYPLTHNGPEDFVVHWRADLRADVDYDVHEKGQPESFIVGRILADEIRRDEVDELGESVWDVADADSAGLESAYAVLLDENGKMREDRFEATFVDRIAYLYRFQLHADFAGWRMAFLDAFCRQFDVHSIILAQYETTWLSVAEFEQVGFTLIDQSMEPAKHPSARQYRDVPFMMRDNSKEASLSLSDYPADGPSATAEQQKWLRSQGPWEGLI